MKWLFSLVLVLITFHVGNAQPINFLDSTNKWNYCWQYWNGYNSNAYSYQGHVTIDSQRYELLKEPGGCLSLIRSDSLNKKIYVSRNYNCSWEPEQLLYDFSLEIGDTLHTHPYKYFVSEIDSTLINSTFHKVWLLERTPPYTDQIESYYVIEGIGSIKELMYPLAPEMWFLPKLCCFSNAGTTPPLNPSVNQFDNIISCLAEINSIQNIRTTRVEPNPITTESKIFFLNTIHSGTISIVNGLGQVQNASTLENALYYDLKSFEAAPGIYYYKGQDFETGEHFQGRFVK